MSNVPPPPPGSPPPPPSTPPPPPPPPPPPTAGYVPTAAQAGQVRAGFWVRFGGYLLDSVLYGLLMIPFAIASVILLAVGLDDCGTDPFTDELVCNGNEQVGPIVAGILVMVGGFLIVAFVYLRALAKTGQTWGRRLVGIKVIASDTGGAPGWGKAIGRQLFANFISANVVYLGYLWMIWDRDKQTWHDKVAGTFVVRT